MPQQEDKGILISLVKYGESTGICRFFTAQQGIISIAIRGAVSKKHRANYQPGNDFALQWRSRSRDALAGGSAELITPYTAFALQNPLKLLIIGAALDLLQIALAEHDPHPALHALLMELLEQCKIEEDNRALLCQYSQFELCLLEECGFRLELDSCVATGITDSTQLAYVSPKSGGAVSEEAGRPYHDKLLILPDFLTHNNATASVASLAEIDNALTLTGYFLENRLFSAIEKTLPPSRSRLRQWVTRAA